MFKDQMHEEHSIVLRGWGPSLWEMADPILPASWNINPLPCPKILLETIILKTSRVKAFVTALV